MGVRRKGGPAHQNTIKKEAQNLKEFGYDNIKFENKVDIPGGHKGRRFTDIMGTKGNEELHIQVGRATQSGLPVAREKRAIEDLLKAGKNVKFVPYNG